MSAGYSPRSLMTLARQSLWTVVGRTSSLGVVRRKPSSQGWEGQRHVGEVYPYFERWKKSDRYGARFSNTNECEKHCMTHRVCGPASMAGRNPACWVSGKQCSHTMECSSHPKDDAGL